MQQYDDPAISSLHRFDDSSLWVIRDNVAVFDAHDEPIRLPKIDQSGQPIRNSDGKIVYEDSVQRYGAKELSDIAANCNRREVETGDACPITLGHTLEDVPEAEQPPIVGYARRFRVGRFGPAKKLAVLATFFIRKEDYDRAMQFPRRSVELWEKDWILDPIALLKRTPQRDLGLLTYERKFHRKIYSMESDAMPEEKLPGSIEDTDNKPEEQTAVKMARTIAKQFFAHPLMRHLAKKYGAEAGCDPEHPEAHYDDSASGMPTKFGAGEPSGGNTFTPSDQTPATPEAAIKQMSEVSRMQREQEAIRYSRIESENASLRKRLEAVEGESRETAKQYRRSQRERDLVQLEAEGYVFDRAVELDDVTDMPAEKFAKHLEKVRKCYKRDPSGRSSDGKPAEFVRTAPVGDAAEAAREGEPARYSRDQVDAAVRMAEVDPDLLKVPAENRFGIALERIAKLASGK